MSYCYLDIDYCESEYSDLEFYFYDNEWTNIEDFNWASISEYSSDMEALDKYQEYIDWNSLSSNKHLTLDFVKKHHSNIKHAVKDRIDWNIFSKVCSLEILKYKEFENYINWYTGSENKNLTDDLIREHKNELDFEEIAKWCSLEILKEFEGDIDFWYASNNKNLSIDLIRRHKQDVDWQEVSKLKGKDNIIEFEDEIQKFKEMLAESEYIWS